MLNAIKRIFRDEDGAVTVDWVVLTAAICALGFAVVASIHGSSGNISSKVGDWFDLRQVGE